MASSASEVLEASPHTVNSGSRSMIWRKPSRNSGWSSTTSIRLFSGWFSLIGSVANMELMSQVLAVCHSIFKTAGRFAERGNKQGYHLCAVPGMALYLERSPNNGRAITHDAQAHSTLPRVGRFK